MDIVSSLRFTMYRLLAAIIAILLTTPSLTESLANCPSGCQCDDDTLVVTCGEGHLDVLPIVLNPSIQRLVIKNNKIKTIDSSIQFYADLTYLDLSYNHLFNIPERTFAYQKKLQELHFNHNKISAISNKTFTGLSMLAVLNMQGNFLDELSASCFATLPKLEELNLGQNRISIIHVNAFEGLQNLRVLYLNDNLLTTVPSPSFVHVPALAELFLGFNSFTTIPKNSFQNLDGLNRLDLNGAALYNITQDTFNGLENIRFMDLSDNRLQRIPTQELSKLNRLEELTLGENEFVVIPANAFTGLANLRKLDISGSNKLRRIEAGAFSVNKNLESLTLASNTALDEIQEGALSGLPHLKHIILRGSALSTLGESLFAWSELDTLDLSTNPIACDCRMMWLRNMLVKRTNNSSQSQAAESVLCKSPERLREQPLKSVSVEQLGCTHTDPNKQAILGLVVVVIAAAVTAIALILYRCRRRICDCLWSDNAIGRKEREYQKTFSEEEYNNRHQHPCSLGIHPTMTNYPHHHPHPGLRPIPVTEL